MTREFTQDRAAKRAALLDILVLSCLILLSAGAFHMAGAFGNGAPGDGSLFPRLASGTVFATALLSLVAQLRGQSTAARNDSSATPDDTAFGWSPIIVAALTLGFLLLLPVIGYPILAPAWMCATMWVFGMRSKLVLASVALGLSALAWLLLARLAYAPPPAGLFERFL